MQTNPPISIPTPPQTKTFEALEEACERALTLTDAIALAGRNDGGKWITASLEGELSTARERRAKAALWFVYGAELELVRLSVLDDPLFASAHEILQALSGFDPADHHRLGYELKQLNRSCELEDARLAALDSPHFYKLSGATKEALGKLSGFDLDQRDALRVALSELGRFQRQRDRAKSGSGRRPRTKVVITA